MLSMVVATISSGALIRRIGYYTPFMIFGVALTSIGAGLFYTFQVDTPSSKWIGYQVLYGFGAGCAFQPPNLAVQTALPKQDVPVGVSFLLFCQLLGGAVFVSVAQNVLSNQLLQRLSSVPGLNPEMILGAGATSLTSLPASLKSIVIAAYNESLRRVFLIGLILACLSMLGALSLEWRSVRQDAHQKVEKKQTETMA